MRRPLPLIALGVAFSAGLGVTVHALALIPDKALVYCPVGIDTIGCSRIVAALSGPEGPFPSGVDRGYDGTSGTVDLATADLSPYAVFIVPSLADDPTTKPYDLLRTSGVAYRLSTVLRGRLVVWSGTPDLGSANRAEKDHLIRNLAIWARAGTANPGAGIVVLQDHSANDAEQYGWLTGFAGLAVYADAAAGVYDNVVALTDAGREILRDGSGQLAYPTMASFGVQPPAAGSGAAADVRGGSADGQVVLVTAPQRLAWVQTDKADYSPGEPVTFTGSGWKPGEGVTLVLHEAAMLHPDRTLLATADGSGNIVNNEFTPEAHDVGVTFYVTAQGQTSGLVAQATFTDAALPNSVKLQQWETLPTGNWTTGNLGTNNSDYSEGEVVPFRLDVGGLATSGNPYTFSVCRNFQSGTKRGYLFLAPFNTSRAAAPGGTITSTNGPFSGVSVTINSVTEVGGQGACATGERQTMVSINSTNAQTAFVLWGGHLAAPSDVFEAQPVGAGNGSASFPGSSLHMKLLSPSKSVSINPAAIKPEKATPTVATVIHDPNHGVVTSVTVGTTVHDKATVSGSGATPTGTVTFSWFTNGTCAGTAEATSSPQTLVNGMVDATGFTQTPAAPGSYSFKASYSGDDTYVSGDDPCELLTVGKASPTVTTEATPTASAGGTISDEATLTGSSGSNATGTISFTVFGPNNATCEGAGTPAGSATVTGDGTYSSDAVPVIQAGTYRWIASYSGDGNNNEFTTQCNDQNETSEVGKASPTVTTEATPTASAGGTISDEATLTGSSGSNATGTISFTVFGPNNATCDGVGTPAGSATVTGDGTYNSDAVPVIEAGTYRWIASYSGDVNNDGFTTQCNDPNETSEVGKASPTVTTEATPTASAGETISDEATLTGSSGSNATGTISFTVFGPNNATCTGVGTPAGSALVTGDGTYSSSAVPVVLAGTYRWIASYSGDVNNDGFTTQCNDPNETSEVGKASPTLTTTPNPTSGTVGVVLNDAATLAGGVGPTAVGPTGVITFRLFDPDQAGCTGTPRYVQIVPVAGNGTYSTTNILIATDKPGIWNWTATYSGDAFNNAAASACGEEPVFVGEKEKKKGKL
ncbi:MAG TPA: Ig-like domain repeat protein [Gemmatimonadales bacterium]|nr:Ig-like domain repeat protein [Gemmatimonadales bacterium]